MKLKLQTEPKLDLKMQGEPQFNLKATTAIVSKGTSNYNDLENKPSINGIELVGNVEITSVSEDAKNISANASSISNLKEEVSKKANQTELDTLSSTVKTNTKSIETNTSDIATNQASIKSNTTDIANIKADVSNKANKTDLDATNKNVATNATNIATNTKNISSNTSDISTLKATVSTKAEQSDLDTTNKNVAINTSAIATETTARENADTTLQANIDTLSSKVDTKQDKLVSGTNIKTINNQSLLGSGNITIESGSGSTEPFFLYKCYYTSDYSKDSNVPNGYINLYQKDGKNYVSVSKDDFIGFVGDFELNNLSGQVFGFKNLPNLEDCNAFDVYIVFTNIDMGDSSTSFSFIDSTKTPIQFYCFAIKTDYGNFWLAMEMNPSSPPSLKQDTLISGTNIKTINNQSLLGSGNITIEGGGATNTVVYETVSTLSALPSTGNLNTLYYVEDIKGYYIYTGEVYRSIDATTVQNNLNTLETTVKGKQDKFTVHESQSIEITSWELLSEAPSWCTDEPYMYRAKVSVSNITENTMILNIVLSDSILLNIGQVIETIDDGIYLYAKTDTALSGTLITLITCEVQNA